MSQIVAGLYEINEPIGSGGGGVVYIGSHVRLNKTIVLKADKRKLTTNIDKLRREVDLLKNLSHTYIPQVYDFVQENGVVYTVMDFIEGESLDKWIKERRRPSQPQMIKWACQLLDALDYLHNRPPYGILHGDIKPANIMLRPNGDICLIDFNIALALGEKGAVKVGFSRGYASPEHYSSDFSKVEDEEKTELLSDIDNSTKKNRVTDSRAVFGYSTDATSNGKKTVLLDARSDIYSLGATLYHLISGIRPAEDANSVKHLDAEICNPEISEILAKAMNPDPDKRYQTAAEMKKAFLDLYHNDRRSKRYRKNVVLASAVLGMVFLVGGATTLLGAKQLEQIQNAKVLSEQALDELDAGNVTGALEKAMQAIPRKGNIFQGAVTSEAQYALTEALGVYQLEDGFQLKDMIQLPAAPFSIITSPNEKYLAVLYGFELAIVDLDSLEIIKTLPIIESAFAEAVFAGDSQLIYAAPEGIACYDITKEEICWTGNPATNITISQSGDVVAAVNGREEYATIYQADSGELVAEVDFDGRCMDIPVNDIFADSEKNIFALSPNGDMLAISFEDGALDIFCWKKQDVLTIYESSEYSIFTGGFHDNYFAYSATNSRESFFGLVNTQTNAMDLSYSSKDSIKVMTDAQGIYIGNQDLLVQYDPIKNEQIELAYCNTNFIYNFDSSEVYSCVNTKDYGVSIFDAGANLTGSFDFQEQLDYIECSNNYVVLGNRDNPWIRVLKRESYADNQLLTYDTRYSHDETRISDDGKYIMLFSINGFRIYDMNGSVVAEEKLLHPESIYDQQYRRVENSSYLEVIWYDGTIRKYDGKSGQLLSEEYGEKPSKDLVEEFCTNQYKIISSPHDTPKVYDRKSDKYITDLSSEDYLTYVTQVDDGIMVEYMSTEGKRYGLLLDKQFHVAGYFPDLCDIWNGRVFFDYDSGNIKYNQLYSLQELVEIGKYKQKEGTEK